MQATNCSDLRAERFVFLDEFARTDLPLELVSAERFGKVPPQITDPFRNDRHKSQDAMAGKLHDAAIIDTSDLARSDFAVLTANHV